MTRSKHNYSLIVFFLSYFFSMQPWFFYGIIPSFIYTVISILLLLPLLHNKSIFSFTFTKSKAFVFGFLSLSVLAYGLGLTLNGFLSSLPLILLIFFIISLKPQYSCRIINFTTKWMAIFISVSLILYFLYLILPIDWPKFYPPNGSYPFGFANQYLNIIITIIPYYYRFQSVFIEPGHMIMGIVPLIFLNRFNLRNKYVIILFIATIFSYSLAGFIYLVLMAIYFSLSKGNIKSIMWAMSISTAVLVGGYFYGVSHPDSIIAMAILRRLEYSDEKGSIAGDNRVNDSIKQAYEEVVKSDKIWFGTTKYDKIAESGGNNGYKIILVHWGIIYLIIVVISFLSVAITSRDKRILSYVLLLMLMVSQNFYPYWTSMLISLICGSRYIKNNWPNH